MKTKSATILATLTIMALASTPLGAAPLVIGEMMQRYNVITTGNAILGSEIEGRTWVGGIATIPKTIQFGFNTVIPVSDYSLIVGNGISSNSVQNINQGSVLTRLPTTTRFNFNSGGTLQTGDTAYNAFQAAVGWTPATLAGGFSSLSSQLDAMLVNGTVNSSDSNNFRITGNSSSAISVVDIAATSLTAARGITLNPNGSQLVVVNVHGTSGTFQANFLGGSQAAAPNFLWNFVDATSLNLTGPRWSGTILAPLADVNALRGISGGMFSKGLTLSDEAHYRPLVTVIPEPSTLGLMAASLLLLLKRRRS